MKHWTGLKTCGLIATVWLSGCSSEASDIGNADIAQPQPAPTTQPVGGGISVAAPEQKPSSTARVRTRKGGES